MDLISRNEGNTQIFTAVHNSNTLGYVAIDSMICGRACGGIRMLPDIEESEIRALARSMTLKYGFLGLPQGGAKAGVFGNPDAPREERLERLVEFGQVISPLLRSKAFIPNADMGTQSVDIRHMLGALGMRVGPRELKDNSSGLYTAHSVLSGVLQSVKHIGLDISQCTAAIEGFGNVGKPLASLLAGNGVKVVAISTSLGALYNPRGLDVNRLIQLSDEVGNRVVEIYREAERIEREKLLELPLEVLCPCARWNSLNMNNAPRISAQIICPGANNPVTPDAETFLLNRGVLCLPDFITNCGGVLGGTLEFASVNREKIAIFINRHIGPRIAWLLNETKSKHQLPREVGISLSLRRFNHVTKTAECPKLLDHLFNFGLELYRQGWIPSDWVAPLSLRYFKKRLT